MKKNLFIFSAVALSFCSCNRTLISPETADDQPATLTVNVLDGSFTKADAYLEQQTYEKQVNSVQILVFDTDGNLNAYKHAGNSVSGISMTTTTGQKEIWAVVNGPDVSETAHIDELKSIEIDLSENSVTASKGFIMVGRQEYHVSNRNTSPASVTVSRLMARVALRSVTHNAPKSFGDMVITDAFLQNVVGNMTLGNGSASEISWYNRMGLGNGSKVIGSPSDATCPELTYSGIDATVSVNSSYSPGVPDLFYCYPNEASYYSNSSSWSPRKTALTLGVRFTGMDEVVRYYTIVLPDNQEGVLTQNTAYTVDVYITGLGSENPLNPISKGSYTAAVTVATWLPGSVLNEVL